VHATERAAGKVAFCRACWAYLWHSLEHNGPGPQPQPCDAALIRRSCTRDVCKGRRAHDLQAVTSRLSPSDHRAHPTISGRTERRGGMVIAVEHSCISHFNVCAATHYTYVFGRSKPDERSLAGRADLCRTLGCALPAPCLRPALASCVQ
jgi:hypothetical protein